ncbi:hypothetical protein BJ508DRAFT_330372 [Ascobolus immersus RN42]|uniref:Uncharacterized protein n=1 Tax=Ascobolus immersus RN42 TaxID=1160509 RepID=A0A3N4HTW7_ASCIM|nr:hypothetical protein BJ508DRAFT_330372 [Ascobolus immersus RN42]
MHIGLPTLKLERKLMDARQVHTKAVQVDISVYPRSKTRPSPHHLSVPPPPPLFSLYPPQNSAISKPSVRPSSTTTFLSIPAAKLGHLQALGPSILHHHLALSLLGSAIITDPSNRKMGIPYGNDSVCELYYEHVGQIMFEYDKYEEGNYLSIVTRKRNRQRPHVGDKCFVSETWRDTNDDELSLAIINSDTYKLCGWLTNGAGTDEYYRASLSNMKKLMWYDHRVDVVIKEVINTDGWVEGVGYWEVKGCPKEGWNKDENEVRTSTAFDWWLRAKNADEGVVSDDEEEDE